MTAVRNWAGNVDFGEERVRSPKSVDELRELVRSSEAVRVLGSRHSFNDIALSPGIHVSLDQLSQPTTIDRDRQTVTCSANLTYGALCCALDGDGLALGNLASLPHISVAGACATATHGSGDGNPNLAAAVVGLELVTGDGELRVLSSEEEGEAFDGMAVNLGGLGVVTRVTLSTVPAFSMHQNVFEDLPVSTVYDCFDEIMASAYSVSLFTDWRDGCVNQAWAKHRLASPQPPADEFFGARPAPTHRHPMVELSADGCTAQMGEPGPWHERLPHFLLDHNPASGDELQTEYFVPREHAVAALRALEQLGDRLAPLLMMSEVRSVAGDRLWMSPSYREPTVGIHFSWRNDWPALRALLPVVEGALSPLHVCPHWGKVFTLKPAQIAPQYPRIGDFRELLHEFDPQGKFRNDYLNRYVLG